MVNRANGEIVYSKLLIKLSIINQIIGLHEVTEGHISFLPEQIYIAIGGLYAVIAHSVLKFRP